MLKRINPKDYTIRPFQAYKLWNLNQGSDGIKVYRGEQVTGSYFISGSSDLTNGVPKESIYNNIKHFLYENQTPTTIVGAPGLFENTVRTIHNYCNVISIPTRYYGEGIRSGSVSISDDTTGLTYTDDGSGNLIHGSTVIGNVIYPYGLIVCTHTGSSYSESFAGNYELEFRATTTIFENEILLEVKENEFNVSQNPTSYVNTTGSFYGFIRKNGTVEVAGQGTVAYDLNYTSSYNTESYGGFADYEYSSSLDPTGSFLAPYITTIGLYDDDGVLVSVAKLAKPVKSLPDFPVNFIIRFDT